MITARSSISLATHLECPVCQTSYEISSIQHYAVCCNQPLITRYDLEAVSSRRFPGNQKSIWRYSALLPVFEERNIISLGEGWTPVYSLENLSNRLQRRVFVKDESVNPTGSFKARGMSVAVSRAVELGIQHCIIPTAGNAGVALSAYCAEAGIRCTVIMPAITDDHLKKECLSYGAELVLSNGLIDDCGVLARQLVETTGGYDMSTLKEPFRLEGKKTIGYELAEQFNGSLPEVIIYPTGGGTGLLGMWKAFRELTQLSMIHGKLPRMVIVQTKNCAPMIELFENGTIGKEFKAKPTIAAGLAVPKPFAKDMMMEVLQESNGTALSVTEEEIETCMLEVSQAEGLFLCPEAAATYMGLKRLIEKNWISMNERVLLFNTGSVYANVPL